MAGKTTTTTSSHNEPYVSSPVTAQPWLTTQSSSHHRSSLANSNPHNPLHDSLTTTSIHSRNRTPTRQRWYTIHPFRGMANDLKRRGPYYLSDWADAWDYRVVPATIYMYFANILPALAFSLDMFSKTNMSYGVNEVLLASVLGAVVFAVFAAQPLVIVGVTGPITVFNYTVYDIIVPTGTNYFAFMCWVGLWSLVMHWLLAATNACNALRYVTRFPCDIFGFYVAFIYLQKGIQVLTPQGYEAPFYLSVLVALLVLAVGYICGLIGGSQLFTHIIRVFIKDYGTPLTVIFFTGFVHIGRMRDVTLSTLPTGIAFEPTAERSWIVNPGNISVADVFLAIPFAILLTILFYFDHNVSALIAQGREFPLRKPAGFHWDLFLLGLTTGIAGILGIPFPNGLIPQAPFHTDSLCVRVVRTNSDEGGSNKGHTTTEISHVVEQRVSNLAQGLLTLGTMTGPLLVVVGLIPQGVLSGLFFVMGVQALEGNGVTQRLLFLLRDKKHTSPGDPLTQIKRRSAIWIFIAIQLLGFGATFAITQTIAAIGFPVIILLLIPARTYLLPKWFTAEELRILDEPTASPFTMESVGGNFGEEANVTCFSNGDTAVPTAAASARNPMHDGVRGNGDRANFNGGKLGRGEGHSSDSDEAAAERGEGPGIGIVEATQARRSHGGDEVELRPLGPHAGLRDRRTSHGDGIGSRPSMLSRRSVSRVKS